MTALPLVNNKSTRSILSELWSKIHRTEGRRHTSSGKKTGLNFNIIWSYLWDPKDLIVYPFDRFCHHLKRCDFDKCYVSLGQLLEPTGKDDGNYLLNIKMKQEMIYSNMSELWKAEEEIQLLSRFHLFLESFQVWTMYMDGHWGSLMWLEKGLTCLQELRANVLFNQARPKSTLFGYHYLQELRGIERNIIENLEKFGGVQRNIIGNENQSLQKNFSFAVVGWLCQIFSDCVKLSGSLPYHHTVPQILLVAGGSLSRQELSFLSDLDLLVIYQKNAPSILVHYVNSVYSLARILLVVGRF
eukprot:TRINITY_DN10855_c0_g1_i7.p1 TRINITY_DN10855_c0_g1~~TRINITY_DN10855_c0_g1_i7.p1  ORF type:complete len:300 (+),score=49.84 TRINITY_DN10855_c0_g1_i7:990-1889(+)